MLAALLIGLLTQQATIPRDGNWVGVLLATDSRGDMGIPMRVRLTIADNGAVQGEATMARASGEITGTLTGKRLRLTLTLFGGGEIDRPDGSREQVGPERCHGSGTLEGDLLEGRVFRLTGRRIDFGQTNPVTAALNRECEDLTRLLFILHPF